ncbi:MAG TPA: histidine kinase dimerization/phospho-acceptor domain-containing protein [Acidimicrobiales bacterium]|nr:histidine kinase dimerization/phospho-acceptor domain-containing protein [Acidimicrobiales bacterium]
MAVEHGAPSSDDPGDGAELGEAALLAVAAHGLLNPLAAIKGFADLLLEREDSFSPDQRREMLTIIRDRAGFASDVLADLVRGLPADVSLMLDELDRRGRPDLPDE